MDPLVAGVSVRINVHLDVPELRHSMALHLELEVHPSMQSSISRSAPPTTVPVKISPEKDAQFLLPCSVHPIN